MNNMNKKIPYIILALILVGAVAWAILSNQGQSGNKEPLREQVEVSLADEERKELEQLVTDRRGQIEASKTQNVPKNEVVRLYVDLALALQSLGDLKGARDAFLEALKLSPGHPGIYTGLFPVYRDMYDYDNARDAVRRVLSANPRDWNMWRSYIELEQHHFNANNSTLKDIYEDAIKSTNHDLNIVTVYAKFLEETGDLKSALNYWKVALQQQPTNPLFKAEVKRLEGLVK